VGGSESIDVGGSESIDRQVIVSYIEEVDAPSIGEITGLPPANVDVRIHRIKNIVARRFREGGDRAECSARSRN
jgi:hypothetical protein